MLATSSSTSAQPAHGAARGARQLGWVALAYAGSATVASLLFLTVSQSGPGVLMAVVPIVGLLATLHFFFRQQEADEAMRRSRVEAGSSGRRRPRCTCRRWR